MSCWSAATATGSSVDAYTAGGRGVAGAPNRSAELTAWSAAPLLIGSVMLRLARIFRWLRDIPLRLGLRALDKMAGPAPETPTDRAIREEGEKLRRAFPTIDFDDPRPRTIPPRER
jgi:hypothetical protein